jgi:hypothetical protein
MDEKSLKKLLSKQEAADNLLIRSGSVSESDLTALSALSVSSRKMSTITNEEMSNSRVTDAENHRRFSQRVLETEQQRRVPKPVDQTIKSKEIPELIISSTVIQPLPRMLSPIEQMKQKVQQQHHLLQTTWTPNYDLISRQKSYSFKCKLISINISTTNRNN